MMQYMVYAVQTSGCDKSTMANAGIGFSRLGLLAQIRKSQGHRHSSNAAPASVDDAGASVALAMAKARPLTACAADGCQFFVNSDDQWGRGAYCCGLCADSGGAKHGKHCERDPASTGTDRAKPDTATAKKKKTKKWKKASAASKDAAHATETATEAAPAQKTKWQQTHEKKAPTAGEPDWLADAGSDESDWGEHKASRPKEAAAASDDPPWGEHKASGSKASLTSSIHPGTYEVAQGFWANAAPSTPSTPAPPVPEDDGDGEPGRRPWRWRRKKISLKLPKAPPPPPPGSRPKVCLRPAKRGGALPLPVVMKKRPPPPPPTPPSPPVHVDLQEEEAPQHVQGEDAVAARSARIEFDV